MKAIFSYTDYREFLRDYYETRKASDSHFSYRLFSSLVGFASPNFIRLVARGKRNLSPDGVQKIINGIRLGETEGHYFETLVAFNQSDSPLQRQRLEKRLSYFKALANVEPLNADQSEGLSHWYDLAIRELTLIKDFREDASWISGALSGIVSKDQAGKSLGQLVELGLLKRDQNNRLCPVQSCISIDPINQNGHRRTIHKEMIQKAHDSVERTPEAFRDISGLTIAVNHETFQMAKDLIRKFRRELNVLLSNGDQKDAVYQINFQIFNLSQVPWVAAEAEQFK